MMLSVESEAVKGCWSGVARSLVVVILSVMVAPVRGECTSLAGPIAGSIIGTAVVCIILFLVFWYFCIRKQSKKRDGRTVKAYRNQGFQPDVERGMNNTYGRDQHDGNLQQHLTPVKGSGAVPEYIACREHQSPPLNANSTPNVAQSPYYSKSAGSLPFGNLNKFTPRSGSHSSLDNQHADEKQIDVPLESQDVVGLGFNISGSMRDGIYVSQVHKRGPASESGHIETGDRIMAITISLQNMVYEDALHILSYASPYKVSLRIIKPGTGKGHSNAGSTPDVKELLNIEKPLLLHPLYRSQSAADITTINSKPLLTENPSFMRRARSEKKHERTKSGAPSSTRSSVSIPTNETGTLLKKWGNMDGDKAIGGDSIEAEHVTAVETGIVPVSSEEAMDVDADPSSFNMPDLNISDELISAFPDNSSKNQNAVVSTNTVMTEMGMYTATIKEPSGTSSSSMESFPEIAHEHKRSSDDMSSSSDESDNEHIVSATIEHKPFEIVHETKTKESYSEIPPVATFEEPPQLPTNEPPQLPKDNPPQLPNDDPPQLPQDQPPQLPKMEPPPMVPSTLPPDDATEEPPLDDKFEALMMSYKQSDMSLDGSEIINSVTINNESETLVETTEAKVNEVSSSSTSDSESQSDLDSEPAQDEDKKDSDFNIDFETLRLKTIEVEQQEEDNELVVANSLPSKSYDFNGSHGIEFEEIETKQIDASDIDLATLIVNCDQKKRLQSSSSSESDTENVVELEQTPVIIERRRLTSDIYDNLDKEIDVNRGRKRKSTVSTSSSSSSESSEADEVDVLIPPEAIESVPEPITISENIKLSEDTSEDQNKLSDEGDSDNDLDELDIIKLKQMLQENTENSSENSSRRNSTSSLKSTSSKKSSSSVTSASSQKLSELEDAAEGEPSENDKYIEASPEEVKDKLSEYFSDLSSFQVEKELQPDTQQHAIGEGEADEVSSNASSTQNRQVIESINDVKFLNDSKRIIRNHSRNNSSSSSSSSDSSASRNSTPSENIQPQHVNDVSSPFIQIGPAAVYPNTPQTKSSKSNGSGDISEINGVSTSLTPEIKRRSGGGLTFDITSDELENMKEQRVPRNIPNSSTGEQYFLRLDEPISMPEFLTDGDIERPTLVRPDESQDLHLGPTSDTAVHSDGDIVTERTISNDVRLSNDLNDNTVNNDKLNYTVKDSLVKNKDGITITQHTSSSYVLSMNSKTHDDSEA